MKNIGNENRFFKPLWSWEPYKIIFKVYIMSTKSFLSKHMLAINFDFDWSHYESYTAKIRINGTVTT